MLLQCFLPEWQQFYQKVYYMNPSLFIAKRISGAKEGQNRISTPMVNIAVIGIALGLAVMLVSVAIITGFKKEVQEKVTGFGAHIQITNFDSNNSFETRPINKNQVSLALLNQVKGIRHAQVYATKAGIIKTKDNIQSIVLKGVDQQYQWDFFRQHLVEGKEFTLEDSVKSNEILISQEIANLLMLKVGDKLVVYFVQDPPRMRPFIVSGIYKTSIEEFDKNFAMVDIRHLQRLNDWTEEQVSGYEIIIDDFDQLYAMTDSVFDIAGYQFTPDGSKLKISNIKQAYPQIFDWLNLQDMNVWIILILMLIVSGVNMITGLLILILDRTNMIGVLKGLGYNNKHIRQIFLFQSGLLIGKGLLWGNIFGIGLCLLQKRFGLIPLDETIYYMSQVPIQIKLWSVLALNLGTMVLIVAMLLVPSLVIGKINPAKAIKFN